MSMAHLLADERLFYRGQVLQGRQEHMCVLRATNVLDELAQFFAQRSKYLILVLNRLWVVC